MTFPTKIRIKGNYFFLFFAVGCTAPFLPPFFKEYFQLTDRQLGLVLMARPLIIILAQPLWSMIADTSGQRAGLAAILSVMTGLVFMLIPQASGMTMLLIFVGIWALFHSPINSLADAVTFDYLGNHSRMRFASFRVFASIGFIGSVAFVGRILDRFGVEKMFPMYAGLMLLAALTVFRIPATAKMPLKSGWNSVKSVLRNRNVLFFLIAILLGESGNQMAYAFLSLHAKTLGAANLHVGWIWGIATSAEVITLLFFLKISKRIGIKRILMLGTFSGVIRWAGFALVPHWLLLIPFQLLHAMTYSFIYVGSAIFMDMESPREIRFTAQAFFSTIVLNAAAIIGTFTGGQIAHFFNYRILFFGSAILGLLSTLSILFLVKQPSEK